MTSVLEDEWYVHHLGCQDVIKTGSIRLGCIYVNVIITVFGV